MRKVLWIFLMVGASISQAEVATRMPYGKTRFTIPGQGEAILNYYYAEEPMRDPERIVITVKCGNSEAKNIQTFEVCALTKVRFQGDTKTLLVEGRLGEVIESDGTYKPICEGEFSEPISLAQPCSLK